MTPGSDVAAAYLTLRNTGKSAVKILSVSCAAAGMTMIHETTVTGGVSRMRPHNQLTISPGKLLKLQPGGLHVMLHNLSKPLTVGRSVPLVLRFSDGTTLEVAARVRALSAE